MNNIALVFTCEHAVDTVPEQYNALFESFQELLATHRGIDFGALDIARHLHEHIPSDLMEVTITRLLIDCNRSIKNRDFFSEVSMNLPMFAKQELIKQYYVPFRTKVEQCISHHIKEGKKVWHFSIHSFTPIMNGIVRNADIGFLYDPRRPSEKELAQLWREEIKKQFSNYRIRMNYPYTGISDGFTTALRKKFPGEVYLGMEVESNQALTLVPETLTILKNVLCTSLIEVINARVMLN